MNLVVQKFTLRKQGGGVASVNSSKKVLASLMEGGVVVVTHIDSLAQITFDISIFKHIKNKNV